VRRTGSAGRQACDDDSKESVTTNAATYRHHVHEGRRWLGTVLVLALVLVPLGFIAVGSVGDADHLPTLVPNARVVSDEDMGFSIAVPPGWTVDELGYDLAEYNENCGSSRCGDQRIGNPFAADGVQFRARFGADFISDEDGCSRSDNEVVFVSVREGAGRTPGTVRKRPARFGAQDGTGIQSGYTDQECDSTGQAISFTDNGRTLVASLAFGRDAAPDHVAQAYEMLDSIFVTTSPWRRFCAVADSLPRRTLTTAQVAALRAAAPTKRLTYAVETAQPILTQPSSGIAIVTMPRGSQRDAMELLASTLNQQCDMPLGDQVFGVPYTLNR